MKFHLTGKSVRPALQYLFLMLSALMLQNCPYPEAELARASGRGDAIPRSQVLSRIRTAVIANMHQCPEHEATALYTLEEVLSKEVRYSYYTKESAEQCQMLIITAPCLGSNIKDDMFHTKYYQYFLRLCGLKKVSD